jgi:DNA modification methylase
VRTVMDEICVHCGKPILLIRFNYANWWTHVVTRTVDGVAHATVKPVEIMRWLIRLITPPGGTLLDPFAGSGTTGEAAIHEHKHAILIEREMSYMPLIIARLHKPIQTGFDFDQEPA